MDRATSREPTGGRALEWSPCRRGPLRPDSEASADSVVTRPFRVSINDPVWPGGRDWGSAVLPSDMLEPWLKYLRPRSRGTTVTARPLPPIEIVW